MLSFSARRSHKHKNLLDLTVFFVLLGSGHVKAASKIMVKLTPDFETFDPRINRLSLAKII